MSEARKCDRCKDFYDIAEEQQDRDTQYEFKGDYINLHLWVARNGVRKDVMSQWYDLCPKCMMELECWLNNNEFSTVCEPDKDIDCADRSNGATEKELELASKLNDAKIYIAQLKSELGYIITKEEIGFMKAIHNFTDEDISEAAKFVETKSSEPRDRGVLACNFDNCKFCSSLIRETIPGEPGIAAIRCARKHKKLELRGANPNIIDAVTPETFDEIEDPELSDPYEDGGL